MGGDLSVPGETAEFLRNEKWRVRCAHLADIFGKLSGVSLPLQGYGRRPFSSWRIRRISTQREVARIWAKTFQFLANPQNFYATRSGACVVRTSQTYLENLVEFLCLCRDMGEDLSVPGETAEFLRNEKWRVRCAHLADIFGKLSGVSLPLQGKATTVRDKITSLKM
ncbi:hypothetical protein PR048_031714 [Dryococelus australis]|uniref:Uncharacterized protein n=1 Tax=Dryococelus australis TaxID=614101 RepID=A0ABQ9G636_9NEOP|nr:hypothetical protein PR048_031714 [Dryococelus australis]